MSNMFINDTYEKERKKLEKMLIMLDKVKDFSDNERPDLANDEAEKLVRAAQKFGLYTRKIPERTTFTDSKSFMDTVYKDTFHITIEITPENWLKITMPRLLPRENGSPWFIRKPLNAALEEFDRDYRSKHDGKRFFIESGVMIYNHRYDKNRPLQRLRDLDNYELNGTSDSIALYFLPDDSPQYCANFEMSEPADDDFTEIYLVPQCDFIKWLGNHHFSAEKLEI